MWTVVSKPYFKSVTVSYMVIMATFFFFSIDLCIALLIRQAPRPGLEPRAAAARTKPPYMGRPLYCYLDCGAPHISKIDARGTGGASLFEAWGHWTSCWEWTTENKLCIFMSFLKGILCKICWLLFFTFKCHWYVLASWECNSANEYLSPELQTPINIWNSKLINK